MSNNVILLSGTGVKSNHKREVITDSHEYKKD